MVVAADKSRCCGCTACSVVCHNHAITMMPDELGFVYPQVDIHKCTGCHLCEKVCMYINKQNEHEEITDAYAVRLRNESLLHLSQSGGAFWALASEFLQSGVVYGAAYAEDNTVHHIRVDNVIDAEQLRGSKYVQSDISGVYEMVCSDLKDGQKVLFTGTGCQVGGLLRTVPKSLQVNLYTVDVICHAIPSPALWKQNLAYIERLTNKKILRPNTRDNEFGWTHCKASYLMNDGSKFYDDKFLHFWFEHLSVRPSCSNCLYTRIERFSDITIGDYWGWETHHLEWLDEKGISLMLIHSMKGKNLFESAKNHLLVKPSNCIDCIQPQLQKSITLNSKRDDFVTDYAKGMKYADLYKKYVHGVETISIFRRFSRTTHCKLKRLHKYFRRIFYHFQSPHGAVLMLHRIDTPEANGIWYNEHLKMSPGVIEEMVSYARGKGCTFVSLDEMTRPKRFWEHPRRQIAITLDDGYRDNYSNGLPVFQKLNVPFCIYVCSKMVEGTMLYWWEILEQLCLDQDTNTITLPDGTTQTFDCSTKEKKEQSFLGIREIILKLPQENLSDKIKALFSKYHIDVNMGNGTLGLTWEQISQLTKEPLCTIGNHTYSHKAFTGCTDEDIIADIQRADVLMQQKAHYKMKHFAFPFGEQTAVSQHDIDLVKGLGFATSATTNDGFISYGTNPLELPRLFVTEKNWKEVIDRIVSNC